MKRFGDVTTLFGGLLAALSLALAPVPLAAQAGGSAELDAYFEALAEHHGVARDEVVLLTEWDVDPEEIPLVLFVARQAGVSTDALMALRRGGTSWSQLARRYGVHAGSFYVPLPESAAAGLLEAAYGQFRSTPRSGWGDLELGDRDLVHLVNLRFLSDFLGAPPERVVAVAGRTGSWSAALRVLAGGG